MKTHPNSTWRYSDILLVLIQHNGLSRESAMQLLERVRRQSYLPHGLTEARVAYPLPESPIKQIRYYAGSWYLN